MAYVTFGLAVWAQFAEPLIVQRVPVPGHVVHLEAATEQSSHSLDFVHIEWVGASSGEDRMGSC